MSLSKKELAIRQKLKDDFPHYSEKCLKIRTKEDGLQPFKLNKAQQFLHEEAERQLAQRGYVRILVVKGRQQGCCLSPDTLITKSNLSVCTIDDLQVGDDVLSIDEYGAKDDVEKKRSTRKMRTAKVEAKVEFLSELFEIKLSNGTTLKATGNHRWLTQKRGGTDMVWRDVESLKIGDTLRAATFNDGFIDRDFRDGWIAGLLDADGSCSTTGVPRIGFSQVDGDVLDGYKSYLRDYGVNFYENIDRRTKVGRTTKLGDKPVHCIRVDSFPHIVRLISRAKPVRFNIKGIYEGRKLPTTSSTFEALPKVLSIRSLGVQRVVDIQTSEKTFIANGIVSHNSTLIGGRFYWKVSHQKGKRAYILTHEGEATANLFDMTTRYHQNVPELVRPSTDRDSGKELHFDKLDSGYKVGTAGAKETGRSQTIQYFHGSEVAFWPNAKTHARGVMQAIPKKSGEVWLESTSDGEGNYFAEMWRDAVLGKNDFIPVFIPWLWQEEYKSDVESLSKTDDEKEYCEIALDVHGIKVTDEQLQFRREKISELGGVEAFQREYPLTPEEAFSNQGVNQLIPTDKVRKALTTELLSDPVGASILGVDVARYGDDRSVWTHRIGRYMKVLKVVENATLTEIAGITKMILDSWDYQACFIDMGMGAGVVDILHEMGYDVVEGVNFGGEPFNKDLYPNKRNEMFGEFIEWLSDEPVCIDAKDQEEADAILMESAAIQYKFDSKSRRVMESKDDMKKRLGFSNDLTDSMVLTFTRPVVKYHEETYQRPIVRHSKTGY